MTERAQALGYDAFGDAAVADASRPAPTGLSLRSITVLFWLAAALLIGGRLYVGSGPDLPAGHAASLVTSTRSVTR